MGTLNLLRLEGKANHFCLKGFIKICDNTCKVQLFWTLKLFVLILTQLFENKIIRCFSVQQTHPTRIPHNKDRIKKQLVAYCLVLLFTECWTGALHVPSHFPESLNCAIISFSEYYIVV